MEDINKNYSPVSLIIGPTDETEQHAQVMAQSFFCAMHHTKKDAQLACFCKSCATVKQHQHHNVVIIAPEKSYVIDDMNIIFERTRLCVDEGEAQLFILYHAEWLTPATANKLLKILEEPPTGNYFILTTDNQQAILPTIQSRSVIISLHQGNQDHQYNQHRLLRYFFTTYDPIGFEQELKSLHLSDNQSIDLAQQLLESVHTNLQKNNSNQEKQLEVLEYLLEQLHYPPQSGSSELFWKNLYLCLPR